MKTGLLMSVVMVGATIAAVGGAAEVWAACVPTKDCATLGYKYTAAQCNGKGVACPFDTSKYFCFEPQICNYTITAETCSSQCLNVGTKSCTKNGITYYESCGASMCSSGQTCQNGTCKSSMLGQVFYCCSDTNFCGSYSRCRSYFGFAFCSEALADYEAQGCVPVFQSCGNTSGGESNFAKYRCE